MSTASAWQPAELTPCGAPLRRSRGESKRAAASIKDSKIKMLTIELSGAAEVIMALHVQLAALDPAGSSVESEVAARSLAALPFLRAQIMASRNGTQLVDASVVDKLRRDAAMHAVSDVFSGCASVADLRRARRESRLPSRVAVHGCKLEDGMKLEEPMDVVTCCYPASMSQQPLMGDMAHVTDVPQEHSHHQVQRDFADRLLSAFVPATDVVALGVAPPMVFTSGIAKISPVCRHASLEKGNDVNDHSADNHSSVFGARCGNMETARFLLNEFEEIGSKENVTALPAQPKRRTLQLPQQHQQQQQQQLQQQQCRDATREFCTC